MIYSDKKLEKLYLKLNCGGDGADGPDGPGAAQGGTGSGLTGGSGGNVGGQAGEFGGANDGETTSGLEGSGLTGDFGSADDGETTSGLEGSGLTGQSGQGQTGETPGFLGSIAQGFSDNMADVPTALNVGLTALGLPVAGAAGIAAGLDAITGAIGGTPDPNADVGQGDQGGVAQSTVDLSQVANGGGPLPPNASSVDAGPIPVPPPLNPGSQFTGFNIPKRTLLQQLAFGSKGGA
jgi:hypothetical protein